MEGITGAFVAGDFRATPPVHSLFRPVLMVLSSRIVLAILLGLGAWQGGASLLPKEWDGLPRYGAWVGVVVVAMGIGYLLGGVLGRWLAERMKALERAADRRPAAELVVASLALVIGLLVALLAGLLVAQLPGIGIYLAVIVALVIAYVFSRIGARKHVDILRLVGIRPRQQLPPVPPRVIDTSAIIDGRLVDVVKTKFLSGQIVVPTFVLDELQRVADSSDPLKRARGRRGLELVEDLKASANGGFSVRERDYEDLEGVDSKLVRLAQEMGAEIVTTDFNLNKVASIHGVVVLNLNDLANALKPAVLPGEAMKVKIIREGREYEQGIGYLADGTMIVVEGGKGLVGQEVDVEVTSVLQSSSGKMIFTKAATNGTAPSAAPTETPNQA